MDSAVRYLCTILARGGSKGLPGKNVRPLLGKPLIAHTVDQARSIEAFEIVVVSSDSEEILDAARDAGAAELVRRPPELASDSASKLDGLRHCISEIEGKFRVTFEIIVDLDPTSPLRRSEDIVGAMELQRNTGATSVITGAPARKSPYFNLVECHEGDIARLSKPPSQTLHRRQDAPRCYDMNAAIYVWKRNAFMSDPRVFYDDTRLYEMPPERSHDIDTPLDFDFVSLLMERGRGG